MLDWSHCLEASSAAAGRTRIPSKVSSFVGREDELSEIIRLLHSHRLVTLTGAGGSGKTRLALAAAGELTEIFPMISGWLSWRRSLTRTWCHEPWRRRPTSASGPARLCRRRSPRWSPTGRFCWCWTTASI